MKNIRFLVFVVLVLAGCAQYHSPERTTWPQYLAGASFTNMTEPAKIAKRPVYLGAGGTLISTENAPATMSYGDKVQNDNAISLNYMSRLEFALYDALRKPGMSVQRAGSDVVVILVRDALMELDAPDISETGADTLKTIAKILNKYDSCFIEIAGYTDSMRDKEAAGALSRDMAMRVGVFLAQYDINPVRMFVVGRGAGRPIAGQDDVGRLTNRRVELRISPAR